MARKEKENQGYTAAEAARVKWENIEANIEFPILTPRSNTAP